MNGQLTAKLFMNQLKSQVTVKSHISNVPVFSLEMKRNNQELTSQKFNKLVFV